VAKRRSKGGTMKENAKRGGKLEEKK